MYIYSMNIKYLYFFLLLFNIFYVHAQSQYKEELERFIIEEKQEKVYLHFDKPHYAVGEDLWFKAYVTNATTHQPTIVSSTLYVELISREKIIVDSLTLFIEDGTTHGSFSLKQDLVPGNYQVRAYTEWMRNNDEDFFYRRDFMIINPSFDESFNAIQKEVAVKKRRVVDFLPEGGDLIDSLLTKVAVKITGTGIKNLQVNGIIINNKGEKVVDFESDDLGYAFFFMTPKIEESYLALIEQDTFYLPAVKKAGALIRVIHSHTSDDVHITVLSRKVDLKDGTLVIHRRGQFLFSQKCPNNTVMVIRIKKSQLETGIIHLTFFDKNRIPLSERLIFPNPPLNGPGVTITPGRDVYGKRSRVSLEISSESDTINSASITINPRAESSYEKYGENIENYLLLNSDLRGKIESAGFYFTGTKEAYKALDLLMLTHGWSRFNWSSLLDSIDFTPKYLPGVGLKIRGKATNYYNDKNLKEPLIGMTIPSIGVLDETFSTNEDGTFQVVDLKLMDSTIIYIQVYKEKNGETKKYLNAKIQLEYPPRPGITYFSNNKSDVTLGYIEKIKKLKKISEAYFLDDQTIELEEVVVTEKSFEQDEMDKRTLYTEPSNRIIMDSLGFTLGYQTVFDLLRMIPGVMVLGTFPNESVQIRGFASIANFDNSGATFLLDGIVVDSEAIQTIPIQDVEFIDVLKGPNAAIYGTRGAFGVVLVYTKRGRPNYQEERPTGLFAFTHPGYHKAKEFYSPQYDIVREEHIIPDFRTTLHWDPGLEFENNCAETTFYSSDQTGNFVIRVEGMFTNGKPFFKESSINVE